MAFLNGFVEEEIYMDQLEGFTTVGEEQKVYRLQRSIYGLKQASPSWNTRFDEVIRGYDFIKNEHDPCVYKKISGSSVAYLVLYVNDDLLIENDIKVLGDIKIWLSTQFSMKNMGEASYILSIKIYRDRSRRMLGLTQSSIWLAWDATDIAVDVLIVHLQCVRCHVHDLRSHSSSLVTVVYGLNDVISRRELWAQLVDIMETVEEDAWLVLGDFNTVFDLSEVCGTSGDISTAMGDFRACLMDTGLITVPTHGLCFMWHNCSDGPRSLWKKLDRDLSENVSKAKGFLDSVQQLLELDQSNDLLLLMERAARLVLLKATKLEQSMLQQRAKIQWLKGVDQCSKIFFRKIAARRAAQKVFRITSTGGDMVSEESEVAAEFINFYSDLLGGQ
ncbi:UNVERIFIED_CONTAM: hypothetical protein Slati_0394800 [Sesamum latifolium]|uniref:Reverse transcriptase Ty1/copia-type domain-containing protein n=1 Tax=Sesamum latifolium TaxID=2727402 RepID=A0AAW2XZJ8_9LAMI